MVSAIASIRFPGSKLTFSISIPASLINAIALHVDGTLNPVGNGIPAQAGMTQSLQNLIREAIGATIHVHSKRGACGA